MYRLLTVTLLGLLSYSLSAQTYYERYFDSGNSDFGIDGSFLPSGELVVAGYFRRASGDATASYAVINATQDEAVFRWLNDNSPTSSFSVKVAANGQAYIGSVITPTGTRNDWAMYQLNEQQDATQLFAHGSFSADEELRGLTFASNGDLVGCGSFGTQNTGMLARFAPDGSKLWHTGFTADNSSVTIMMTLEESGTDFVVVGIQGDASRNWTPMVSRFTEDGQLLWGRQVTFGSGNFVRPRKPPIVLNEAGEMLLAYVVVENDGRSTIVMKISPDGDLIWSRRISSDGELGLKSIAPTANGKFVLAGYYRPDPANSAGALLQMDEDGNIEWGNIYGADRQVTLENIISRPTGDGILAVGQGEVCGRSDLDVYLLSVDENGGGLSTECGGTSLSYEVEDYPVSLFPGGQARSYSFPTSGAPDFLPVSAGITTDFSCFSLDLDADNSSGFTGPDFQRNLSCIDEGIPIGDVDLAFTGSGAGLDSIVVVLAGAAGPDSLATQPNPAYEVTGIGSDRLVFTGLIDLSNAELLSLLNDIRYFRNNAPGAERTLQVEVFGGCDISQRAITRFTASTEAELDVDLGGDISICIGAAVRLDATTSEGLLYNWSTGADTSVVFIDTPGDFAVTVTSFCGAVASDTITIVPVSTELTFLDTTTMYNLCFGDSTALNAFALGADSYLWSDGLTESTRTVSQAGPLAVQVANGCDTVLLSYQISFTDCCELYVPNAFSPNGDGVNDRFRAFPSLVGCNGVSSATLRVYDRWGGEVFEGEALQEGWDGYVAGEPANNGVYAYILSYLNGQEEVLVTGDLSLLR